MKITNRQKGGYVVPVAIAVLVLASIGLLGFSWFGGSKEQKDAKKDQVVAVNNVASSTEQKVNSASDDATLDNDGAAIDAQIKALDKDSADITSGLSDTPASL